MGKYFQTYGSYRLTHAVSDMHRNHPEMRNGIDSVIKGKQTQYTCHSTVVNSRFKYRFYADDDKDVVNVEITCISKDNDVDAMHDYNRMKEIVQRYLMNPDPCFIEKMHDIYSERHSNFMISDVSMKAILTDLAMHIE